MKKNRLLALLLVLSMLIGALAGCGAKPQQEEPATPDAAPEAAPAPGEEAQEVLTLDILVDVAAPYVDNSMDTVIGKKIAEDHGIAFNYVGYEGDMAEYQAMMLAGGTFNEIAYMRQDSMVKQYIEADALIN